jgi:cobyrinic acid a,c-diamide synthase
MRAFVIAGTHSGVGKTTVTLGILAALHKRGLRVQAFKVGPDFIDPGHHTALTGIPSRTLDGWMLSREYNQHSFLRYLQDKDIGMVEGVMGLFDGYDGKSEVGSTAEIAKWLGLPVILVVDASAMARSVAALIQGFRSFDSDLNVAGVVFNRIGGPGHLQYLREALEELPGVRILGGLPSDEEITIPERHLGLTMPQEHCWTPERINRLASLIEENLDLTLLLQQSKVQSLKPKVSQEKLDSELRTPNSELPVPVRFGIARDEAFCFYYPDNLELLEQAGAELVFFSPLHDSHLPENLHGLYFGGGYPEVYAHKLSINKTMREEVKAFVEQERVVYAECGGFMYLTQGIRDLQGSVFPMVSIYPTTVRMLPHLSALGYIEVEVAKTAAFFPGGRIRGHEFHYSELETEHLRNEGIESIYQRTAQGGKGPSPEGYLYKRCLASYVHLHMGSNPEFAAALVQAARVSTSDQISRVV